MAKPSTARMATTRPASSQDARRLRAICSYMRSSGARPPAYLRSTVGTARSLSGASKNCRTVKLNIPAMRFEGNIWILLL